MYFKYLALSIITSCFFATAAFAENKVRIIYDQPESTAETMLKKEIQSSHAAEDVAAFINEMFKLDKPLLFIFGGSDGPLYDPESNEILIPYSFVKEIKNRFKKANYTETGLTISDAAMDALVHTLFHEFAHALINAYELPVLGKEEDAADSLANVLLIEFFENGDDIVIIAADLFDLESEDINEFEEEDFWDEHSLDAQRFYTAICHVYGSNPEKYASFIKEIGFSEQRAAMCIEDYEKTAQSWAEVLEPYFKDIQ